MADYRPPTFGEAFNKARREGRKEFTWRGGLYSTKTAEEQSREIGAEARKHGSGRGQSVGRRADDRDVTVGRADAGQYRGSIPTPIGAPTNRPEPSSPSMMERMGSGLSDTALKTLGALPGMAGMARMAGPAIGRGAVTAYKGAKDAADTVRGAVQASRGLDEARRARLRREREIENDRTFEEEFGLPNVTPSEAARGLREMERERQSLGIADRASSPELGKGVWRSAREKAEAEARNAKPRVQVEGTKGGVYRSAKDEKSAEPKAEFRSRTADRMDEREMGMKRGGKVKTYTSGGSVRGAGIAQRGVRKCRTV